MKFPIAHSFHQYAAVIDKIKMCLLSDIDYL